MPSFIDTSRSKRRLTILNVGLVAIGMLLGSRLFDLQIRQHRHYLLLAGKEHLRKYTVPARRGNLYWQDGDQITPMALNEDLNILYGDPTYITDPGKTAQALASITGDPASNYVAAFAKKTEYVALKTKVSNDMAKRINALKLDGIGLSPQQFRVYPEGSLGSQITGFVNSDGEGQYGIEGYFNDDLSGQPGLLKAKTDTRGIPIATADNLITSPKDGSSYVLTIDRNIQAQSEKFLKQGVEAVGATSGSVVIIDPKTGSVRAMANYPTYDHNDYGSITDYAVFGNMVVSNLFEPGSGFKVFTMSAGLDTGKIKADTTYDDTGSVNIDGTTIRNAENHHFGQQTMLQVIQNSLNTGVIYVLKSLGGDPSRVTLAGKKLLYEYFTNHFGFGTRTGIEQPDEAVGSIPPPKTNNVSYANMTFGQGLSTTMMQMVMAVGAIANGGTLYQPHLVAKVIKSDLSEHIVEPRVVRNNIISQTTISQLIPMMEAVVQHGSGYLAKMPGYRIAGKTGTAQIPDAKGGYAESRNIGSFVGFAPAENPRFVLMVRINEPKVSGFAESTTVPVFSNITKWLINYYAIAPSS